MAMGMEIDKCGFSFNGDSDIFCSGCKVRIQKQIYEESEEILSCIHALLSPSCPKLKDIELVERIKTKHAQKFSRREECNDDADPDNKGKMVHETGDPHIHKEFHPGPRKPSYHKPEDRRQSFDRFVNCPISEDKFAEAGFYYDPSSQSKNRVTCFWCGGSLKDWREGEVPWEEHAKYYPGCVFLRQQKGIRFILRIRASMSLDELAASENQEYSGDLEVFGYGNDTYHDVYSRLRSLRLGPLPFTDEKAVPFAKQGFYWSDTDNDVVKCYYCGIRMDKQLDVNTVAQKHKDSSDNCAAVRGQIETLIPAQPDHTGYARHLLILPCKCTISTTASDEFPNLHRECPFCRDGVKRIVKLSQPMEIVLMNAQD